MHKRELNSGTKRKGGKTTREFLEFAFEGGCLFGNMKPQIKDGLTRKVIALHILILFVNNYNNAVQAIGTGCHYYGFDHIYLIHGSAAIVDNKKENAGTD